MSFFLRHLELFLTAAGLVVVFGATALFHPGNTNPWTIAAVTAVGVGVIHGVIFWVVRERQRAVRRSTLHETERMLRDIVINQLAIIRISVDLQQGDRRKPQLALQHVEQAIGKINSALTDLSEESLTRWRARYEHQTE
ncbi:MAG TPA: hypothetical protein VF388_07330 [Lacunisphaera sp.]